MLNKITPDPVEMDRLETNELPGSPSSLICPECGGAIWEINRGMRKFR